MGDCKDGAEQDADTTNNDVGDAEERVAATHNRTGSYDDGLGALVFLSGEVWISIS